MAELERSADVVVIGGGCVGVSIAYHLAQRGAGKIVLLEKKALAYGSTGRSAAIIRQHYAHPTVAKMALNSLETFANFEDIVGGHADFVRTGFMIVVGAEEVETLNASVAIQQGVGINVQVLNPEEIKELEPAADILGIAAAAYEPDAGYVDPHAVVTSYAEAARRLGARLYQGTPATEICVQGERVTGVITPAGVIAAPVVVNAAGPWANQIGGFLGIHWPLHISSHHVTVLGLPQDFSYTPRTVCDMVNKVWFRPETGLCLIVGSTDDEDTAPLPDPENPDSFIEKPVFDFSVEMAERISKRYPIMEEGEIRHGQSWSGPSARTPDMNMLLGELPELRGFFCAFGLSGHGFKLSPMIGALAAEMITNGAAPDWDLSLFRVDRFVGMDESQLHKLPASLLG